MPNFIYSLFDPRQIDDLLSLSGSTFLLGATQLSRRGRLQSSDLRRILTGTAENNSQAVLLWDLSLNDQQLAQGAKLIEPWLDRIQGLRISDPGAARWVRRHWPEVQLQFSLEYHGVNERALKTWAELLDPSLLVLSNQLPVKTLQSMDLKELPPLEMQALGPLEVFFSSRRLLCPEDLQSEMQAVSNERPRQVYRLWQSQAGTAMLHSRELFLLDQLNLFEAAGIGQVRLEFTTPKHWALFAAHQPHWAELKALWPTKVTRGFFSANRTDRPLSRLTNRHLAQAQGQVVGQVLQAKKRAYCLIELQQSLSLPQSVEVVTPEGGQFTWALDQLKNLAGQPVGPKVEPGVYRLPHQKGALARSLLLL